MRVTDLPQRQTRRYEFRERGIASVRGPRASFAIGQQRYIKLTTRALTRSLVARHRAIEPEFGYKEIGKKCEIAACAVFLSLTMEHSCDARYPGGVCVHPRISPRSKWRETMHTARGCSRLHLLQIEQPVLTHTANWHRARRGWPRSYDANPAVRSLTSPQESFPSPGSRYFRNSSLAIWLRCT